MSLKKPFRRTIRPNMAGSYSASGMTAYIKDQRYAKSPTQFTRAYLLLQKDLINLFEYIEPADVNLRTCSYRIHELLLRACIEFESNCKAILDENGYINPNKSKDWWNIKDYKKINKTHHLSSYEVTMPVWRGKRNKISPFKDWESGDLLSWYTAYNNAKHDRHSKFEKAKFGFLLQAVCGVLVVLSSQFHTNDMIPGVGLLAVQGADYGIGDYFEISFPRDWDEKDKYDFNYQDWQLIKQSRNPFNKLKFDT